MAGVPTSILSQPRPRRSGRAIPPYDPSKGLGRPVPTVPTPRPVPKTLHAPLSGKSLEKVGTVGTVETTRMFPRFLASQPRPNPPYPSRPQAWRRRRARSSGSAERVCRALVAPLADRRPPRGSARSRSPSAPPRRASARPGPGGPLVTWSACSSASPMVKVHGPPGPPTRAASPPTRPSTRRSACSLAAMAAHLFVEPPRLAGDVGGDRLRPELVTVAAQAGEVNPSAFNRPEPPAAGLVVPGRRRRSSSRRTRAGA